VALNWFPNFGIESSANDVEFQALHTYISTMTLFSVYIHKSKVHLGDAICTRIPTLAGFGALRALHMAKYNQFNVLAFCQALVTNSPRLETLALDSGSRRHDPKQWLDLTILSQLDHLTDLEVTGYSHGVEACRRLTSLSVTTCRNSYSWLNSALASPSLRTVRCLSIQFLDSSLPQLDKCDEVGVSWSVIFSNLCSLSSLTLRDCKQMNVVVPALIAHGRTMMLCALCFASDVDKRMTHMRLPSIEQLGDILTHLPLLTTLRLELPDPQTYPDINYIEFVAQSTYPYMENVRQKLRPAFPNRRIEMFDYHNVADSLDPSSSDDNDDDEYAGDTTPTPTLQL